MYKAKKPSHTQYVLEWIEKTSHHFGLAKYVVFSTVSNNALFTLNFRVRRYH